MCQNTIYTCGCRERKIIYCPNFRRSNACNKVHLENVTIYLKCYRCGGPTRPLGKRMQLTGEVKTAKEVEQEEEEGKVQM